MKRPIDAPPPGKGGVRAKDRHGREGGICVDVLYYRNIHSDLADLSDDQLLMHWNELGKDEGRIPSHAEALGRIVERVGESGFDWEYYEVMNPDLQQAGITGEWALAHHFLTVGESESRVAAFHLDGFQEVIGPTQSDTFGYQDCRGPNWQQLPYPSLACTDSSKALASSILRRSVDEDWLEMATWLTTVAANPAEEMLALINTGELADSRHAMDQVDNVPFCFWLYESFEGRLPTPGELDHLVTLLDHRRIAKDRLVQDYGLHSLRGYVEKEFAPEFGLTPSWIDGSVDPATSSLSFHLPGRSGHISVMDWQDRKREVSERDGLGPSERPEFTQIDWGGEYETSVISSLYRCEPFLDHFLANVSMQTAFNVMDIILICVDPQPWEVKTLRRFADGKHNVQLEFVDSRLPIYSTWNHAVLKARAPLLTNFNVDDTRRPDSVERQLDLFRQHAWADVVYQDVFYSLEFGVPWDFIRQMGFRARMAPVTLRNLLSFNSPHNAPMWRRELHDEVGCFDESLESAGDLDFWLRCASAGKQFIKDNDVHVAYFVNPEGLSTRLGGPAEVESRLLASRYAGHLAYGRPPLYADPPSSNSQALARSELLTSGAIRQIQCIRGAEVRGV